MKAHAKAVNHGSRLWYVSSMLIFLWLLPDALAQSSAEAEAHWQGKVVFQEKGCNYCHPVEGEAKGRGPDLIKHKFYGTNLDLAATMWNHSPLMFKKMKKEKMNYPAFTETEIAQIVSYLAYARYGGEPGNSFRGEKLIKAKQCISCHKFGGQGGDIGPDFAEIEEFISPLRLAEAMWNHGPGMMASFEKLGIDRPEFQKDDIVHIAQAIQSSMRPTKIPPNSYNMGNSSNGKTLIQSKGCINCHSVAGEGADVAPDFKDIDLNHSVLMVAGMMWNHGPKMWEEMKKRNIEVPKLDNDEMADIIAYLYGLGLQDHPGDPRLGEALVKKKKCISCHAANGKYPEIKEFAAIGGYNSSYEMIAAMWNQVPEMEKKQKGASISWTKLDGAEMANIYAYINSLASKP